jgi:type VI protein secretion system component Hcp
MRRIITLMSVLCLFTAAPAQAAFSLFGYVDGIAGISPTDDAHSDWIDVLAIQLSIAGGTTLNTVGPITGNFVMTKAVDGTSAGLASAMASGSVLDPIKIDIEIPSGLFSGIWTMNGGGVVAVDPPPVMPPGPPAEDVTLTFSKISYKYTEFDNEGNEKGAGTLTWDPFDAPPIVSTQGTLDGFMLLNNVAVPEPGALVMLTASVLGLCARRRCR